MRPEDTSSAASRSRAAPRKGGRWLWVMLVAGGCNAVTGIGDLQFSDTAGVSTTHTTTTTETGTSTGTGTGGGGSGNRFDPTSGVVHDNTTGLYWQQGVDATKRTWDVASAYCTGNEAGLPDSGWRLPTGTELSGIVDTGQANPAIDPVAFPATPSELFWTSDKSGSNATAVGFSAGKSVDTPVDTPCRTRCVRP